MERAKQERMSLMERLRVTLEMIKIEHTVFALPFALLGATLASLEIPPQPVSFWLEKLFWIVVAMVGARSAAMTFNRIVDRRFDAANPRTANRALPAGLLDLRFAWIFTIVSSAIFLLAAWRLNRLTLMLAPVALASVFLYSYTKRFTALSHLVLGWCLSIAPTGAWLAITGEMGTPPLLLSLAVMLWTAGFDIIYACQDYEFDREAGLHSIPGWLGIPLALMVARVLHALMFLTLVVLFFAVPLEYGAAVGILVAGMLLSRQHNLVSPDDLSRLNAAFFTMNAYISIILFVSIALDVLIWG